ncbi:MAG: hypothetical protein WKF84_26815 [Pyrinomonadaceae bacterium]
MRRGHINISCSYEAEMPFVFGNASKLPAGLRQSCFERAAVTRFPIAAKIISTTSNQDDDLLGRSH